MKLTRWSAPTLVAATLFTLLAAPTPAAVAANPDAAPVAEDSDAAPVAEDSDAAPVAEDSDAAPVAEDSDTPLVPADAGPAGSGLPLTSSEHGVDAADASAAAVSVCTGGIDYPHISGTNGVTYTISVHFDGVCRATPTQHNISGSLYRHRWFGWEHLRSKSVTKPTARKLRLPVNKGCSKGALFRYRGSGRFYALVGKTSWSRSFYNENADEIKCVRTPGASS